MDEAVANSEEEPHTVNIHEDTTDGLFSSLSPKPTPSGELCFSDDEAYNMSHKRRGKAIIFNHETFCIDYLKPRTGTDVDSWELRKRLRDLKFEVEVYKDLPYLKIKEILYDIANEDHSDADCFLLAVMTHGEPGLLYASDTAYRPDELWMPFVGDKCPSLVEKPKMVFIQACRGTQTDDGIKRTTDTRDSIGHSYTIPAYADFLIAFSTVDGFYSWRSPENGSWFIQELCRELKRTATKRDLLTVLTFVCRRVALNYQSSSTSPEKDSKKQMPCITTTLTKLVFFCSRK